MLSVRKYTNSLVSIISFLDAFWIVFSHSDSEVPLPQNALPFRTHVVVAHWLLNLTPPVAQYP